MTNECPCCQGVLDDIPEDGLFCWTCGIYADDDPANCDQDDH